MFALTVRQKHYLIIGLVIVGLLVTGALAAGVVDRLNTLHNLRADLAGLARAMLSLRREEKDFLARLDLRYVEAFDTTAQLAQRQAERLADDLAKAEIESGEVRQVGRLLQQYQARFAELVAVQQRIGLHHEDGLYGGLREQVRAVEAQVQDMPEVEVAMLMLRRHEKDFMLRRDPKYAGLFDRQFIVFADLLESTSGRGQLVALSNAYRDGFQRLVAAERQKGLTPNDGIMASMRETVQQTEGLFESIIGDLSAEIDAALVEGRRTLLMALAGVAATLAVLVFAVSRSIYLPLAGFAALVLEVTRSKNLSARMPVRGEDEISVLAESFNELLSNLHALVGQVADAAQTVASAAEEMSMATVEVQAANESQCQEVEHASVAVNEMTSTIQDIARSASLAADTVTAVHGRLEEGSAIGADARREIELLTAEVQGAVRAIQELERNSSDIGAVLDAIQNIAEQTNLLALNAAIEAARAGEHGRGFAVVADEVRTLAQRTRSSTESIRQTITKLQTGTQQAVETVMHSNQRAGNGIERVTRASEIFDDIAARIRAISDMNTQVAAAAEQQSVAAEEIGTNLVRVTDLSQNVAAQSSQASAASQELAQLGVRLRDLVTVFKL